MSENKVETRILGASQIEVSAMGIGIWSWGDKLSWGYGKNYGFQDVLAAYKATLAAGVNFFDTAEIYGNGQSEKLLHQCMQLDKQPLKIATKFAPLPYRLSAGELLKALDKSLERLGVSSVELYQVHWPYSLLSIESVMDMMALAVQAGKIKAIGVSNYNVEQMKRAQARLSQYNLKLASNQVHYSLLYRKPEANGVLQACRDMNIALIAYSPLEQGLLTGKYGADYKAKGLRRYAAQNRPENLQKVSELVNVLKEVGQAHDGKTPAQVSLRWLLQRDELVIPIPGAKNEKQASQNAGALGWELSQEEFDRIDKASRGWLKK